MLSSAGGEGSVVATSSVLDSRSNVVVVEVFPLLKKLRYATAEQEDSHGRSDKAPSPYIYKTLIYIEII